MARYQFNRSMVDRWVLEHSVQEHHENSEGNKKRDKQRQFRRLYRASVRGFAIGFLLRGGLHSVSAAARVAKRQAPGSLLERSLDTLRWACAVGCFGGVYVGVDEALRSVVGCHRSASYRAAIAGACAGPAILLTGLKARHDEAALYLLLRSITLLVRIGNKPTAPPLVHKALALTRWRHGDTALMCIACWQILSCYLLTPTDLPPSFIRFLDKMAGFPKWFIPLARELAIRKAMGIPKSNPIPMLKNTPYSGRTGLTMCDVLHPERCGSVACDAHFLDVIPQLFRRSLGVYVPVYAASTVAVQRAAVFKQPFKIAGKMLGGVLRSTVFLTAYVALAHRAVCLGNTFGGGRQGLTPLRFQLVAWIPGLATMLEKKSRRMELALYCICRAILSFYSSMLRHKGTPRWLGRLRTDILALSVATAAVMHCHSGAYGVHRDIFRSKYLNVLDFIFGSQGVDTGLIAHARSNREIVSKAGRAVHKVAKDTMRSISSHNLLAGLATS